MPELEFPNQLNNFLTFCNLRNSAIESKSLDLQLSSWFYPTTLLPLGAFIKEKREQIKYIPPANQNVANYLSLVTGDLKAENEGKTYIPIINLPPKSLESESGKLLGQIFKFYNNGKEYGGENAFKYLISELVDNIYQHSEFKNAFLMAQRYEKKGFMEICFFDDGITISGSFSKHGMVFEDSDAILEAINGLSTKGKERGFGLGSNLKVFTQGLPGEMLIVSGKGAAFFKANEPTKLYILQDKYKLEGTLISVRIPYPVKEVDIYEFI
ncbi:MAG: ATP-binding protein [Candidatus Diapherotrites archaeon]|uniref:ATP-binding protein n=1 Tax=Candidatus Iainarchaeum sp. TaxID=3101447 RepID=A0A8T4KSL6_9ARCH|nr:ATP-binding protein [Candidatus Diapherotrites archaeon]